MRVSALMILAVLAAGCGGKPVQSKEELTSTFAYAAVPTTHAKGAALMLYQSGLDQLPAPAITVKGTSGGEATLKVNPVGVVVGLAGRGVMVDMEYKDYSEDGAHWLDGDISALTQFDYVPGEGDADYADVKIGLVGQLGLSGVIRDALDMDVTLTTRFQDLQVREDTVSFRLDGTVDTPTQQFKWDHEDLQALWNEAKK
ncbi:MAG: hypothetical protein ACJ790_07035 [Myxococcaceae bacterium]